MKNLAITPPMVYVVDDDVSIRESLSSLIRAEGMAVEVFASPLEFLAIKQPKEFSCMVLDVRMPGMDGLSLQDELNQRGWDLPVIFISGHGDVPDAVRAMKAGAIDFLKKPFDDFSLLKAITSSLSRVSAEFNNKCEVAALQSRYNQLTPREKEVLAFTIQGRQNKFIAYELGVVESTIKVHRHNIMGKMQFRSLPALVLAMQRLKANNPSLPFAI